MSWDTSPAMITARMGVRDPGDALGHQDVRHDLKHALLRFPPDHVMDGHEENPRLRCRCSGGEFGNRQCCARMTGEDLLCDACRHLECGWVLRCSAE